MTMSVGVLRLRRRLMQAPERLTVPTCVGCGAVNEFGTCETGCSERKLELVRAAVNDWVGDRGVSARARSRAFRPVVEELACRRPSGEDWERAYPTVRYRARSTLRRYLAPRGGGRAAGAGRVGDDVVVRRVRRDRRPAAMLGDTHLAPGRLGESRGL